MLKKVFGHSIIYAIGPQLPKVAGLFLLPIITPFLTDFDFGVWGIITAFVSVFTVARDLGLVVPLLNSYFKNPMRWRIIWGQLYFFLLVFGLIFAFFQGLVIGFILPDEIILHDKIVILTLLTIQTIILDIPNLLGVRYFQISERPIIVSSISFMSGLTAIIVQYICVVHLGLGYMSWFYSAFYAALISFLFYVILLYRAKILPILRIRRRFIISNLKISLPLLPHNYSAYLLNASDRAIMKWYDIAPGNIGKYNVAYMWGNYMDLVGGAIGTAVSPIYYDLFKKNSEESNNLLQFLNRFLQISFVIGSFIIATWSKELFEIFIKNDQLKDAYLLASIIVMGYCYRPMYWLVVNKLQFFEKTNVLWKISLIGGLINVVLNIVFIHLFGYKAAAFTTFVALMYIGFSGFFFKEFKALDSNNYKPLFWLILILLLTTISYFIQDYGILYKAIVTLLGIVVIIYFAYQLFKISKRT